jgi:hypothetical protein
MVLIHMLQARYGMVLIHMLQARYGMVLIHMLQARYEKKRGKLSMESPVEGDGIKTAIARDAARGRPW